VSGALVDLVSALSFAAASAAITIVHIVRGSK